MSNEEAIKILERKTTIPGDGVSFGQIEEAIEMAISALRTQQQPNAPLTLEELREMDRKPVWVESYRNAKCGKYVILDGYDQELHCLRVIGGGLLDCTVMEKSWLAYRRRPEKNV